MKLLNILKTIILEENRLTLGSFTDVGGDTFFVVATTHSQDATKDNTKYGRVDVNTLGSVIFEFSDVFSEVAKSMVDVKDKKTILVRDYLNRFDFIIGTHLNKDGTYSLHIITSIRHPNTLSYKPENKLIIIKKDGDLIIEQFVNTSSFTKITKNNIIIYYER